MSCSFQNGPALLTVQFSSVLCAQLLMYLTFLREAYKNTAYFEEYSASACVFVCHLQMNAVDTLGQTALHRAALAGHIQTCRLLLSYGADPAIISLQGFTAAQMGNEAVQQILNGKQRCGKQLCHVCVSYSHTLNTVWRQD